MESISLEDLSSLVKDIHVKKREASQNTDLDMREFLGIDKILKSIQGEFLNKTSKLTEINKYIKRDTITKSKSSSNASRKNQTNS